jgi:putative flippase GtrA
VTVLAVPAAQASSRQLSSRQLSIPVPSSRQPSSRQPSSALPRTPEPGHHEPVVGAAPSRRRELASFAVIGTVTTIAYLLLYAVLQPLTGDQLANAIALVLTVDANTVANRRFSFGLSGSDHAVRQRAQGWLAFGVSLAATSASLAALDAAGVSSGRTYLVVLVAANVASGILHFILLRSWAFARR